MARHVEGVVHLEAARRVQRYVVEELQPSVDGVEGAGQVSFVELQCGELVERFVDQQWLLRPLGQVDGPAGVVS